jgi:hypothetical protein
MYRQHDRVANPEGATLPCLIQRARDRCRRFASGGQDDELMRVRSTQRSLDMWSHRHRF